MFLKDIGMIVFNQLSIDRVTERPVTSRCSHWLFDASRINGVYP